MTPDYAESVDTSAQGELLAESNKVVLKAEELAFGGGIKNAAFDSSGIFTAQNFVLDLERIFESIVEQVELNGEPIIFSKIDGLLKQIQDCRYGFDEKDDLKLKRFFQNKILPYTNQSEFCGYSYCKPRGYAGDFGAMELIWKGRTLPHEYRYRGDSATGELINAFTLDSANCRANEHRVNFLSDLIKEAAPKSIASIGCGSAIELELLAREWSTRPLEVCLFDQDVDALNAAQDRLSSAGLDLRFNHGNIIKSILKIGENSFDFIYSSGMFDYFEQESAQKLVRKLWSAIKPGGRICITNAHPANPTRLWMEYVGEWNLVYRNLFQILEVMDDEIGISEVRIVKDKFSVYQYLVASKR